MASITFSGQLDQAMDEAAAEGNKILFIPQQTVGEVLPGAASELLVESDGTYSITLAYNTYSIYHYSDVTKKKTLIASSVVVSADTEVSTIPDLIGSTVPITEDSVLTIQGYLTEAQDSAEAAATSEINAAASEEAVNNRVAAYEVETTDYLINSFDGSALAVGDVVRTLGYNTAGDGGGAEWVKTSDNDTVSQSPIDRGTGEVSTAGGYVFMISTKTPNPLQFGAVNSDSSSDDSTSAFTAMTTHCDEYGLSWVANGDYYVDYINTYVPYSGNFTLYSSNDGQSYGVINILKRDDNLLDLDVTDFNSQGGHYSGQDTLAEFASYAGYYIKVVSTETYITRSSDSSSYRYEYHFKVLDDDGKISPPLPYDWDETVLATAITAEKIDDKFDLPCVNVVLSSGTAGDRTSAASIERSNVKATFDVKNNSDMTMSMLIYRSGCNITLVDSVANGAGVDSTNYGYNVSGCLNSLINCSESDCRRGSDAHYSYGLNIIGGNYPSGIGAHFGFDTNISQVSEIGYSSSNDNPLYFTGGNVSVTSSKITTKTGSVFSVRADAAEVTGDVIIKNCDITLDWTGLSSPTKSLYYQSSQTSGPDYGRDLEMPKTIRIKDNNIKVLGTGHGGELRKVNLFSSNNTNNDYILDTEVLIGGNNYSFEDDTSVRYAINKVSMLSGDYLNIYDDDRLAIEQCYFGNGIVTYSAPYLNFYCQNSEVETLRCDYGWVKNSDVLNGVYTTAVGSSEYQSDSLWLTTHSNGAKTIRRTITDDSVFIIDLNTNYGTIDLSTLNYSIFGKFTFDADGNAVSLTAMYSNGVTIVDSVELTGTYGTDGDVTMSVYNNKLYIENREGGSRAFRVSILE